MMVRYIRDVVWQWLRTFRFLQWQLPCCWNFRGKRYIKAPLEGQRNGGLRGGGERDIVERADWTALFRHIPCCQAIAACDTVCLRDTKYRWLFHQDLQIMNCLYDGLQKGQVYIWPIGWWVLRVSLPTIHALIASYELLKEQEARSKAQWFLLLILFHNITIFPPNQRLQQRISLLWKPNSESWATAKKTCDTKDLSSSRPWLLHKEGSFDIPMTVYQTVSKQSMAHQVAYRACIELLTSESINI